jgi:hypothetical protein
MNVVELVTVNWAQHRICVDRPADPLMPFLRGNPLVKRMMQVGFEDLGVN